MFEERIKTIISKQLGQSLSDIADSDHFVEDLGADSIDIVEIITALEEEFKCSFLRDEFEQAYSVDKIVALLTTKKLDQT